MDAAQTGEHAPARSGESNENKGCLVAGQVAEAQKRQSEYCSMRREDLLPRYLPPFGYVKDTPMVLTREEREKLESEIAEAIAEKEPPESNRQEVEKLVSLVQKIGRQVSPSCKVYAMLFGSRLYDLCTSSSDVDIVVNVKVPNVNPAVAHARFFNRLAKGLRQTRGFTMVVKVPHARIPIIKFQYVCRTGEVLDGDISLNSSIGLSKSNLIASFVDMDPRVRQLLMMLKLWGSARRITNQNTLNSYGLLMMGIAFLISRRVVPPLQLLDTLSMNGTGWKRLSKIQRNAEGIHRLYDTGAADSTNGSKEHVISCIQTRRPLPDWRVDGQRAYFYCRRPGQEWKSPNKSSVAVLLYEFFRYYGCEFDAMHNAISPRLGSCEIPRSWLHELQAPAPDMYLTMPMEWRNELRLLAIEDPFDLSVNCARNATPEWCEGLLWEMRRAAWTLLPKKDGHGSIERLLLEPSTHLYSDPLVWATAYHRLFPTLQALIREQVFDPKEDAGPASIIDLQEHENSELSKIECADMHVKQLE
ncbi:hypothetical protein GGI12_002278 [Dipsacomyces acuminosporus]|nr:hypothetical protein GGI12_002278 [Dipsacomyces acuminosporus]